MSHMHKFVNGAKVCSCGRTLEGVQSYGELYMAVRIDVPEQCSVWRVTDATTDEVSSFCYTYDPGEVGPRFDAGELLGVLHYSWRKVSLVNTEENE